jgi:hypothetical protein
MTTISKSLSNTQKCVKKLCRRIENLEFKDTTYGQHFYNPSDGNGYTFTVDYENMFNVLTGSGNNILVGGENENITYDDTNGCYTILNTGIYNVNATAVLSVKNIQSNATSMVASRLQRSCVVNNGDIFVNGVGNYSGHTMSPGDTKTFVCNAITSFAKDDGVSLISSFTATNDVTTADMHVHSWNFTAIKIDN